jgi:hypothetical protein
MGSPLCFWAADDVLFTHLTVYISNALCFEDLQVQSISLRNLQATIACDFADDG